MSSTTNDRAQPLLGFRTNEEWEVLLAQVAKLIEEIDAIEDVEVRRKMFAALEAIDAVHREALHRLVRLFKEGVLDQVVTDPAIHTLMAMYDLVPSGQARARKAIDFLTPEERAAGLQRPAAKPADVLASVKAPADLATSDPRPHWTCVRPGRGMANGDAMLLDAEGAQVIVARVDNTLFAIDADCPTHGARMEGGTLTGFSWVCPHGVGCVYDIRNGSRIGGGPSVAAHPVRPTHGGDLQVGFGVPFEPKLPAF